MWPLSKAFCRIYQNDVFFAAFVVVALAVGFISAKVLIGKKCFHSDVREKYS